MAELREDPAVTRFREYLRFPSVHPDPDYSGCIDWIRKQAQEIGLDFNICSSDTDSNEFAIWLTWHGIQPKLKSVLLNSHMDVVPIIEPIMWAFDPFGAEKDEWGNIHARGAVDMKCVGAMYLEAIRRLKSKGFQPLRTLHVSFVPDEEVGGFRGMGMWIRSLQFQSLNVGFALDEGLASGDESYNIYYGERAICQFRVKATGDTGDAFNMVENSAGDKLNYVIGKFMALRANQQRLWRSGPHVDIGEVTSVNLTMFGGGIGPGILPPELSAVFDIRITPRWKMEDVMDFLYQTCVEAGPGVSYTLGQHSSTTATTSLTDDNLWWLAIKSVTDNLKIKLNAKIFPVATDVRFIRESGIPSLGFSPMNNMPNNIHTHDEFIHEITFLNGIFVYEKILENLLNVPPSDSTP